MLFLPRIHHFGFLAAIVLVALAPHTASAAAPAQWDLSAAWLGKSFDEVHTQVTACALTGQFFGLRCRTKYLAEPIDVEYEFGANRQAQKFSVSFVNALDNAKATSLYDRISQQLKSQFPIVTEDRKPEFIRRVFIQRNQRMATATFMPANAVPYQLTIEMTLMAPALTN